MYLHRMSPLWLVQSHRWDADFAGRDSELNSWHRLRKGHFSVPWARYEPGGIMVKYRAKQRENIGKCGKRNTAKMGRYRLWISIHSYLHQVFADMYVAFLHIAVASRLLPLKWWLPMIVAPVWWAATMSAWKKVVHVKGSKVNEEMRSWVWVRICNQLTQRFFLGLQILIIRFWPNQMYLICNQSYHH